MRPIELETIKIRLEGVRLAIGRCRFAFFVSMIASVAIIVTVWNAYMSPDAEFALQPHWSHDKQFTAEMLKSRLDNPTDARKLSPDKVTEVTDQVQQEIVSEWVKNQVVSVGLLGIRVSVEDFSVLGSLGLLVTAMLLFYCVRSENISIGNLLKHAPKFKEWDDRYLVYQGIVPHLIFLDLGHSNKPIEEFENPDSLSPKVRIVPFKIKILLMLPAFTILLIVIADLWTLFRAPNPFRPSGLPLWRILDKHELQWLVTTDAFALLFFLFALIMCIKILKYATASGQLIEKFRTHLLVTCDTTGPRTLANQPSKQPTPESAPAS
jgi:hypothetical protein